MEISKDLVIAALLCSGDSEGHALADRLQSGEEVELTPDQFALLRKGLENAAAYLQRSQ